MIDGIVEAHFLIVIRSFTPASARVTVIQHTAGNITRNGLVNYL